MSRPPCGCRRSLPGAQARGNARGPAMASRELTGRWERRSGRRAEAAGGALRVSVSRLRTAARRPAGAQWPLPPASADRGGVGGAADPRLQPAFSRSIGNKALDSPGGALNGSSPVVMRCGEGPPDRRTCDRPPGIKELPRVGQVHLARALSTQAAAQRTTSRHSAGPAKRRVSASSPHTQTPLGGPPRLTLHSPQRSSKRRELRQARTTSA